jgi:hypothetical protein
VYARAGCSPTSPSEIAVPAPSGLFASAIATVATLTVPSLIATAPVKLFVVEMVSVRAAILASVRSSPHIAPRR